MAPRRKNKEGESGKDYQKKNEGDPKKKKQKTVLKKKGKVPGWGGGDIAHNRGGRAVKAIGANLWIEKRRTVKMGQLNKSVSVCRDIGANHRKGAKKKAGRRGTILDKGGQRMDEGGMRKRVSE